MPKGEVVPAPAQCIVTSGAPLKREPGEDKRVLSLAIVAAFAKSPRAMPPEKHESYARICATEKVRMRRRARSVGSAKE
jgi:hypothetical protein